MKADRYLLTTPDDVYLSDRIRQGITVFCRVISTVFSPLVVPVIGIALLLYGDTILNFLPDAMKNFYLGLAAIGTLILPLLSIMLMRTLGLVGDLSLSGRRERFLPLVLVLICYVALLLMIRDMSAAFLIKRYLFVAIGCTVLILGVTPFWKISVHMVATGGLSAMLALVSVSGLGDLLPALIVAIFISGLLGSAQLWLGHHTPAQVVGGWFGGFAVAAGITFI